MASSRRQEPDLEDFILLKLAETAKTLSVLFGESKVVAVLKDGVEVEIEEQNPSQPWRERLEMLLQHAEWVIDNTEGLEFEEVIKKLLKADGWTLTPLTFRTPIWLLDYYEPERDKIADDFEGLEWIRVEKSL